MSRGGIAAHELPGQGATNDWLTPKWILDALGPFDLDPCASESNPTRVAPRFYTWRANGLTEPWDGFVFCNPPYGPHAGKFLAKLAAHGNGIGLVFARTETRSVNPILRRAHMTLFLEGRLTFQKPDGNLGRGNAGAPSMLLGFGAEAVRRLETCDIPGARLYPQPQESGVSNG